MAYADQLYEVVDRFFMQIVMPYGVKNGEAAVYLKKFTPFKKKNFDEYVQAYNDYMNAFIRAKRVSRSCAKEMPNFMGFRTVRCGVRISAHRNSRKSLLHSRRA